MENPWSTALFSIWLGGAILLHGFNRGQGRRGRRVRWVSEDVILLLLWTKQNQKFPAVTQSLLGQGSVHPGSPRAEWTFPGTNLKISPETEVFKLHCVLRCTKNAWNALWSCCVHHDCHFLQICPHCAKMLIKNSGPALQESCLSTFHLLIFFETDVWL